MTSKVFVLLALVFCCEVSFAAEADWEILNLAIANPGRSNPEVLKNSILNILKSFGPETPQIITVAPTQPTVKPPVTTAPTTAKPCPVCPPAGPCPACPTAAPPAAPATAPPPPPFCPHYPPIFIPAPAPSPVPAPAPQQPVVHHPVHYPIHHPVYHHKAPKKPCGPHDNAIANFLVNVPCPTTTTTPKPIRQIVVKVPCPTTTKKPCECQCCPCNPCPTPKPPKPSKPSKPSKTTKCPKHHRKQSSEESHEESAETKTIYKSYDPVMQKYVDATRNYVPAQRSIPAQSSADYQRSQREYLWK